MTHRVKAQLDRRLVASSGVLTSMPLWLHRSMVAAAVLLAVADVIVAAVADTPRERVGFMLMAGFMCLVVALTPAPKA